MHTNQPSMDDSDVFILSRPQRIQVAIVSAAICGSFLSLYGLQRIDFDWGQVLGPCGFRQQYDLPCPTCGMTTAVLAFSRGEPVHAFRVQPAIALICSILVLVGVLCVSIAGTGQCPWPLVRLWRNLRCRHVVWALAILVLAGWAWTLSTELAARS